MNITVFGATGSVGRHVVEQALAAGHRVCAFARHADAITAIGPNLDILAADVLDPAAVRAAVEGRDAVVVVIGAGRRGGVRAAGTQVIVDAMRDLGVQRLVCQSTLGVGDSRANLSFYWRRIMFGLLLRPAFADHVAQETVVRASGLDWTIVRPSAFTDEPGTGQFRSGFGPDERGMRLRIPRADVAHSLLVSLDDDASIGATLAVST